MDIRQDPNSIPHFSSGDRLGELQADQPEQRQSSVLPDPSDEDDAAAGGDTPVGSGRDSPLDNGSAASVERDLGKGPDQVPEDLPAHTPDESRIGKGAIDGLVGAP